jgi:hypothetical protein
MKEKLIRQIIASRPPATTEKPGVSDRILEAVLRGQSVATLQTLCNQMKKSG